MLHHSYARDLVEARLARELPIITQLHIAPVAQPRSRDALPRRFGLRVAERDAEGEDAVATRGMHDETAPAATDVE